MEPITDVQPKRFIPYPEDAGAAPDAATRSAPAAALALVDGPFAEAREMVGGFFLIDVATREEALAIARRCPAVAWATVEVRECAPCHVL